MKERDEIIPEPAQRLRTAREAAGYETAKGAARRFGWSADTYAQHENGTRGLGRVAGKYARAFKVSEGWLLTGEGSGPGGRAAAIEVLRQLALRMPNDEALEGLLRLAEDYTIGAEVRAHRAQGLEDPSAKAGEQAK